MRVFKRRACIVAFGFFFGATALHSAWIKTESGCKVLAPKWMIKGAKEGDFESTWTGECVRGKTSGVGTLITIDAAHSRTRSWEGKMLGGVMQGTAVVKHPNGDSYEGPFKDGEEHGVGRCVPADKSQPWVWCEYDEGTIVAFYDRLCPPGTDVLTCALRKKENSSGVEEEKLAKALAIAAGLWLVQKAGDTMISSRGGAQGSPIDIGDWGSWLTHSPLIGGKHREARVTCTSGLSFQIEEHLKEGQHWFQRDAGAVLSPKRHGSLEDFMAAECHE